MNLLRLIDAVKTMDDRFYQGDVQGDIVQALTELHELRETVGDSVTDIENELKIIKAAL